MNLTLPSPAYLLGLLVFGIIGWVAFRRGRKTGKSSLTWLGVATMLYPYLVDATWLLWVIGGLATAWICVSWN